MSKCDLAIQFDQPQRTYRPGEQVSGQVVVQVNRDVQCNGLALKGIWRTHGRGNRDQGTYYRETLTSGEWRAGQSYTFPFRFTAPETPWTYRGNYLNLDHYVQVRVDIPWSFDPKQEEEWILLPGDKQDSLEPLPDTAITEQAQLLGKVVTMFVSTIFIVVGLVLTPLFGFGLIFVAVGGLILFASFRKMLAQRRLGQVIVQVDRPVVTCGDVVALRIALTPRASGSINGITATLVGHEQCISGSGTNKRTHTHQLHHEQTSVAGTTQLVAHQSAEFTATFSIPETEAYSVHMNYNKVAWFITVGIDIPRWPDWSGGAVLRVIPPQLGRDAADQKMAPPLTAEVVDTQPVPSSTPSVDHPPPETEPSPHELQVESMPASAIPPENSGVTSSALLDIAFALTEADRHSDQQEQIVDQCSQRPFDVAVVVDRTSSTYGYFDDRRYSGGTTISGNIQGTSQRISIRLPKDANDQVRDLRTGSVWQGRGTIVGWDRLYDRLEMQSE